MPASTGRVAIVVPVYRDSLTDDESISLCHLERVLGTYDRYVFVPKGLRFGIDGFHRLSFPARFFQNQNTYSALMLSPRFYRAFRDYEYILVYQLDSLVFSDELDDWCDRGIDYVGAPWLHESWVRRLAGTSIAVGNGGFSLRNVGSFLRVLTSRRYWMDPERYWRTFWADRPRHVRALKLPMRFATRLSLFNGVRSETRHWVRGSHTFRTCERTVSSLMPAEDVWWSFQAQHYEPTFTIAAPEDALQFAFERHPRECFEQTGRRLPFGAHAWALYDRAFWEPYLLTAGG
jgi:Protein of unknown function (DUF5672)